MTRPKRVLPRLTWDQAEILQLASGKGLQALGFKAHQLRRWSANGHIHPVATAPGGAHLFHIPTVRSAAEWEQWKDTTPGS